MAEIAWGMGVSAGVAMGRVFLLHAEPLPVVPDPIPPERVEDEIERFHAARADAAEELEEMKRQVEEALGERHAGIFEAQKLVLEDPALVAETMQRIRVGRVSARWALKEVVTEFIRKFDAIDDDYIRERGGELADVHTRMQRLLRGEPSRPRDLPEGPVVVVAHAVGPSDAVLLAAKQVKGLATDVGGRTSHTAILAQALSLPAVVGLHDFSRRVREGDPIILDGDSGQVIVAPGPGETAAAERRREESLARESEMVSARDLPAVTRDGTEIVLRANIEFPAELDRAIEFGAHGIGLYRSEFLFLSRAPHLPTEQEHYETYLEIARKVHPEPVFIRTLDLGGEKYFQEVLEAREPNPVLGLRAIRFCLRRPDIFRPQIRGLIRAAGEVSNLRVTVPLVTSIGEIRAVRDMLREEADDLAAGGHAVGRDLPLGIMIEVPAAAAAADVLAREADYFSIGTNDLIQYALAVDRSSDSVAHLYHPLHPGVLRLIRSIITGAQAGGVPVSVCGEMAADLQAVALLLGLGVRELSVQPRAIAAVRRVVRATDLAEAEELAEQAIEGANAGETEPFEGPRP